MKGLFVLSLAFVVLLCSCTAENSDEVLICKALYIKGGTDGFEINALFTTTGGDTMESEQTLEKSYKGKTASDAIDNLLKDKDEAMFKPTKILVLQKGSPYNREIVKAYLQRNELQLKCMVYESEGGFYITREEGIAFAEYYRKIMGEKDEY